MASESRGIPPSFPSRRETLSSRAGEAVRPAKLSAWRIGQLLKAMVVERIDSRHVLLDVDGGAVRAQAPADLPIGTQLRLRVEKLGDQVVLAIVDKGAVERTRVHAAIRNLLPQQGKLTPLLSNLTVLSDSTLDLPFPMPDKLNLAARQLLTNIPHASRLMFADALRDALRDSGIFLESRLAQQASRRNPQMQPVNIGRDFKGNLLRFVKFINTLRETLPPPSRNVSIQTPADVPAPTVATKYTNVQVAENTTSPPAHETVTVKARSDYPPVRHAPLQPQLKEQASLLSITDASTAVSQIKSQIDGALNRIQLMQLSANPAESGGLYWLFELPMRHDNQIDLWQVRLEQESSGNNVERMQSWTATLSFALGTLGPVHARISLRGGKVSTMFWAERAATADIYTRSLDQLTELYHANGLTVGALACQVGEPHSTPPERSGLLDVRA